MILDVAGEASAQDLRANLVRVAARLFYAEGLRTVGVDRVASEAGVAKATLYRYFANKDDLILACLEQRQTDVMASMRATVERAPATALDRVGVLFLELGHLAMQPGFRGCPFLLAMTEYPQDDRIAELTRQHKRATRALFATAIGAEKDPTGNLAGVVAILYEGASVLASVEGSTRPLTLALRNVENLLRAAAID